MENKDKVLDFYTSGRYQCDLDFHVYLRDILLELNVYQWQNMIQQQLNTLNKIKQLTQINAKCLQQDYDDEQGVCQTFKIKSLINQLSSKSIPTIIKECEDMSWQPYTIKIKRILNGCSYYQSILQRIQFTVHSQQFRIDSMLFTAFFYFINGNRLDQCIQLYSSAIQYYLNYLNKQKHNIQILYQASQYSNVLKIQRTKDYVGTLFFILRYCLRFCEIIKILTGKNNLSLKFTVLKKEMDKLIKRYPEWKVLQQKEDLFQVLPAFKQHLKLVKELSKDKVCRWCFKQLTEATKQHFFCNSLIFKKELFV